MIRIPRYLDEELLRTLADYLDLESAESRDVRRTTSGERKASGHLKASIAQASLGRGSREEEEERYSAPVRPVRLLNDVVDSLTGSGDLISIEREPSVLIHRSCVEISGSLKLSPVSEVATVLAIFLPLLQSGVDLDNVPADQVAGMFIERRGVEASVVVEIQPHSGPYKFASVLQPGAALGAGALDELEGEFTVFGTLDRVLGDDDSLSLEQYMLPGLNRTLRRALGGDQLGELLATIGKMTGRTFDAKDLTFHGPGALLKPVAIYP